jgi:hypothetical protein
MNCRTMKIFQSVDLLVMRIHAKFKILIVPSFCTTKCNFSKLIICRGSHITGTRSSQTMEICQSVDLLVMIIHAKFQFSKVSNSCTTKFTLPKFNDFLMKPYHGNQKLSNYENLPVGGFTCYENPCKISAFQSKLVLSYKV